MVKLMVEMLLTKLVMQKTVILFALSLKNVAYSLKQTVRKGRLSNVVER